MSGEKHIAVRVAAGLLLLETALWGQERPPNDAGLQKAVEALQTAYKAAGDAVNRLTEDAGYEKARRELEVAELVAQSHPAVLAEVRRTRAELHSSFGYTRRALHELDQIDGASAATEVRNKAELLRCKILLRLGRLEGVHQRLSDLRKTGVGPEASALLDDLPNIERSWGLVEGVKTGMAEDHRSCRDETRLVAALRLFDNNVVALGFRHANSSDDDKPQILKRLMLVDREGEFVDRYVGLLQVCSAGAAFCAALTPHITRVDGHPMNRRWRSKRPFPTLGDQCILIDEERPEARAIADQHPLELRPIRPYTEYLRGFHFRGSDYVGFSHDPEQEISGFYDATGRKRGSIGLYDIATGRKDWELLVPSHVIVSYDISNARHGTPAEYDVAVATWRGVQICPETGGGQQSSINLEGVQWISFAGSTEDDLLFVAIRTGGVQPFVVGRSSGLEYRVSLYTRQGKEVNRLVLEQDELFESAYPVGHTDIVVLTSRRFLRWNGSRGSTAFEIRRPDGRSMRAVTEQRVAVAWGGSFSLLDTGDGREIKHIDWLASHADITNDETYAAVWNGRGLELLRIPAGEPPKVGRIASLDRPGHTFVELDISPDGKWVGSTWSDGMILLWEFPKESD